MPGQSKSETDPFNLQRFIDAQQPCYEQVRAELAAGAKRTHWMWFIFPQVHGLGSSAMAQRYAISGLPEAAAYLEHPCLGLRLRDCTALINAVADRTLQQILGYPDNLKFHSSVTLFAWAATRCRSACADNSVFQHALDRYFESEPDQATVLRFEP